MYNVFQNCLIMLRIMIPAIRIDKRFAGAGNVKKKGHGGNTDGYEKIRKNGTSGK